MGRTVYYTAATLDGYLADEHDSLDWLFACDVDEQGPMGSARFFADVGALTMGATTYEWVRRHLAAAGEAWPYTSPCWVFTHRRLPEIPGADLRFVAGDVAVPHEDMRSAAGEGTVWVVGGGDLAARFAAAGRLDELQVSIAPATLGSGRPLFPRPFALTLLEVDRNRDFACLRYAVTDTR